ncbi:MAG: acyl-CoA dehydrogenase family protein [Fimbriimonadaceae bacterium]|nr:acyl-CoA dehydrogenase family protein [Fimbriimonadaceae bacterium]
MNAVPETTLSAPAAIPALTQDESRFLASVQAFCDAEVAPFSLQWEKDGIFPPGIWTKLGDAGLLSLCIPESLGGPGRSCRVYCEAVRLLSQADPALGMNVAAINSLAIGHIVSFGTPAQQERWLDECASGRVKMAWALTEPDAGSDARRVQMRAEPIPGGEGRYRLIGEKFFITNGGLADLLVVIARKGPDELGAFLVESNKPGFRVVGRIPTVGVSTSWTSHLHFEGVEAELTPCRFEDALGLLYRGRLGIAAMALGIAERAQALTLAYASKREQFNRKLSDMQSVQNMLADSETDLEAARLLLQRGAAIFDLGLDVVQASSMAKLFASEAANRVTNRSIQIHGGRGMVPEYCVEKLWRDAKLTEIGEGCSEIQRMVIAKQALRRR